MADAPDASARVPLFWIALQRVVAGGLLGWAGIEKARSGFRGPQLLEQLATWQAQGRTFGFAGELLATHVQPRADLFALLVTGGEIAAGVSLVLGLASRLGALAGLALNGAYLVASGESINALLLVVHLAVLVTGGGRALGLDGPLRARSRAWFLG